MTVKPKSADDYDGRPNKASLTRGLVISILCTRPSNGLNYTASRTVMRYSPTTYRAENGVEIPDSNRISQQSMRLIVCRRKRRICRDDNISYTEDRANCSMF